MHGRGLGGGVSNLAARPAAKAVPGRMPPRGAVDLTIAPELRRHLPDLESEPIRRELKLVYEEGLDAQMDRARRANSLKENISPAAAQGAIAVSRSPDTTTQQGVAARRGGKYVEVAALDEEKLFTLLGEDHRAEAERLLRAIDESAEKLEVAAALPDLARFREEPDASPGLLRALQAFDGCAPDIDESVRSIRTFTRARMTKAMDPIERKIASDDREARIQAQRSVLSTGWAAATKAFPTWKKSQDTETLESLRRSAMDSLAQAADFMAKRASLDGGPDTVMSDREKMLRGVVALGFREERGAANDPLHPLHKLAAALGMSGKFDSEENINKAIEELGR
jgi:hypothetical protein